MASFGVTKKYKYYEFSLDSYTGTQAYTSSESKLDWPVFKVGGKRPLKNIAGVKIIEAEIPFTYYVLNENNNKFILRETGFPDQIVVMTETLPGGVLVPALGNYSAFDMTGSSGLFTRSLNFAADLSGSDTVFNVTYDEQTQKFRVFNGRAGLSSIPFSLIFGNNQDDGSSNPRFILGFSPGETSSTYTTVIGDNLQGSLIAQVTGANYVYLNSQKLGNLVNMYLAEGGQTLGNSGPQLAKIPINVQPNGICFWRDPDPEKYFDLENLDTLTEIDMYLTLGTDLKNPLRLNGGNFSFKLAIIEHADNVEEDYHTGSSENRVSKRIRF